MMTDVAHGGPGPSTSVFQQQQQEEEAKKPLLGKNGEKFGKKLGNAAIFVSVPSSRVLKRKANCGYRVLGRQLERRLSMGSFRWEGECCGGLPAFLALGFCLGFRGKGLFGLISFVSY